MKFGRSIQNTPEETRVYMFQISCRFAFCHKSSKSRPVARGGEVRLVRSNPLSRQQYMYTC